MSEFVTRTGLADSGRPPRRYLWTDAFAVGVFLDLFRLTGAGTWLDHAAELISQVHQTLGRHRSDDSRTGWISGLDEAAGQRHPTAGGLRIGKTLNEPLPEQPADQREEWDRDGQYFHYLTKWMQALARAAAVTSDASYCRWALELARTAHAAFTYQAANGQRRMFWKMSIDLSRPLVSSMGHHDPLDAFVTYHELEHCRRNCFAGMELPDLRREISEVTAMCAGRSWATDDPLGLGGLLVDACRICELQAAAAEVLSPAPASLLADAGTSFAAFGARYSLNGPAGHRLAFRELGLAIGLHAIEDTVQRHRAGQIVLANAVARQIESLFGYCAMAVRIEAFWRTPGNQASATWSDHRDINSVMLAASLLKACSTMAKQASR